jgi:formate dehydrogenase alpha subunit
MEIKYVPTICPYCGCGCGIYLVVKEGEIVGVEPWKGHPVNEGKNCPKGKNAFEFLYNEERLKKPLIKKNGGFREVSWETALEIIADKLKGMDGDSVGFINSGKLTNEDLYLVQKFARCVMKTNNLDNASRFCHSTTVPALLSTVGSGVMPISTISIEKADCLFIAGTNIKETYPLIARRVKRAKEKGAKVIVSDPRRTLTAKELSDIHLQLNPGTDTALINAMMKIILEQGLENKEFIEKRAKGFSDFKNSLSSLDLTEAERITGISIDMIKEAAETFAISPNGCVLYTAGIAQHFAGIENVRALSNLCMLTGNYGRPGTGVNPLRGHINGEGFGDVGPVPVFYPGFRPVNEENAKLFEKIWDVEGLPSKPGMTYMDMIENCHVVWVAGANPMASAPDTNSVRKMLEGKDLLVVQDIFMNKTAELADVVLPAAAWVEKDGTITEVDRRVQRIGKAVDPPGEAKPDWKIFCDLAHLMGDSKKFQFNSPAEIFEEIRKCVPQYKGITYEKLDKAGGIQWPCPSEDHPGTDTMFVEKFGTPDDLAHFQIVEYKHPAELTDEEYPYVFTNGRIIFHFHSGTMTRKTKRLSNEVSRAFAEINIEDAKRERIKDGDEIVLKSRRGELKTIARVTDDIRKGLLFMPWHFTESGPNVLTGPSAGPPSKMPEFKFCAVKIEVKQ